MDSILKRGIANSNITNVMKITRELHIDTESLATGSIISSTKNIEPTTIAAHLDGSEFTDEQWERIQSFAKFIKQEDK